MFSKEFLAIITESAHKGFEDGVNNFYRTLNSSIKQMDAIAECAGTENFLIQMLGRHQGVDEITIHECSDEDLYEIYSELIGMEE